MGFHGLRIGDYKVGGYWGISPMRDCLYCGIPNRGLKASQPQAIGRG
jgi:hypothetical protein